MKIIKPEETQAPEQKTVTNDEKIKIPVTRVWQIVSGVLLLLLVISVAFGRGGSGITGGIVAGDTKVSEKAIEFINKNLLQPGMTANLSSATLKSGLYELNVTIQGKTFTVYATQDGKYLMPSIVDMDAKIEAPAAHESKPIEKSEKPTVQLFVMSQCPYGVQAENAIKPVLDALKGKINFELRFIANANGDGTFGSLHGQAEVDEDIRQVCAAKIAPEKMMDYVVCRNKNIRSNEWKECAKTSGIDTAALEKCATGEEGKTLLTENIKIAEQLGIGGSPTIKINGGDYAGARSPEAYKQAICDAFTTAPAECGTTMSSTETAAEGNCE